MKIQFSTAQIFQVITFFAIAFGGLFGWLQIFVLHNFRRTNVTIWDYLGNLVFYGPHFLHWVFAAYALGKRRLTIAMLVCFAVLEGASLAWLNFGYFR